MTKILAKFREQIFSKEQPKWVKSLNLCILWPIILWPLVFYASIFSFDNTQNLAQTYFVFFLVNAFPVYLIIIAYLNSLLFQRNRVLGSLLPLTILLTIILGVVYIAFKTTQVIYEIVEREIEEIERKNQGFISSNDEFKIIDNKVYRYDTLIVEADAKTFETIDWDWQRDKNYYYRFGKKITTIDRQSFELLGFHYGKDNFHVYYDENIIIGADAKTFQHIPDSQDGKDANNCYRWGDKVDCDVLLTGE